jgi:hypothetical protein
MSANNKERPMQQPNANPDEFTLDRERLTAKMLEDYGEPVGIDSFGESDPERIAQATRYATYGGAVACPAEITMIVDALPPTADAVILSLCESHEVRAHQGMQRRIDAGLSNERQVSLWSLETEHLIGNDAGFLGFCSTLEHVCAEATKLLPSFRAMLDGEQRLIERIAEPLTVLKYDTHGRLGSYPSSVETATPNKPASSGRCSSRHSKTVSPTTSGTVTGNPPTSSRTSTGHTSRASC